MSDDQEADEDRDLPDDLPEPDEPDESDSVPSGINVVWVTVRIPPLGKYLHSQECFGEVFRLTRDDPEVAGPPPGAQSAEADDGPEPHIRWADPGSR